MAKTKIDWADKVWNPVTGCTKISEGCRNCYAERMSKRLAGRCGYPADEPFRVTLHPEKLEEPLKWKKPQRIFVCSMGDLFHEDVPERVTDKIFKIITLTPRHTYLMLTKRPERMAEIIPRLRERHMHRDCSGWPLSNLWLGVTVENQQAADERIPVLLRIPAAKRFISIEPMLGPVDISEYLGCGDRGCESCGGDGISWVILGGETGPKARPMHPDWARTVRDQCQAAGVPFFFKQWGEWAEVGASGVHPGDICMSEDGFIDMADKNYVCFANESEGTHLRRVGKKRAGYVIDEQEYREWPE